MNNALHAPDGRSYSHVNDLVHGDGIADITENCLLGKH